MSQCFDQEIAVRKLVIYYLLDLPQNFIVHLIKSNFCQKPASRLRKPPPSAIFVTGSSETHIIISKIELFVKTGNQIPLTDDLEARQRNEFIIDDFENTVKTGYRENAFGCGSHIAKNKPVRAVS